MSFATHLPFPTPPSALSQSQVSSNPSTPTPTRATGGGGSGGSVCCENGRPVLTDPATGQSVCSCQYSSALLGYSRLPGLSGSLFSPSSYSPGGPPTPSGYGVGLGAEGSAFYAPLGGAGGNMRDSTDAWRSLTQSTLYDTAPMGFYPYGGYGGLDLNARRKNATRESTNTLKAWLHEHIKNPYPTKGEKIMLAIITKMTLTQVSTWFANARRRLKKENKMTWSPRNRSEDGDDEDDDDDGGTAGDEGSGALKGGEKDQEKEKRLNHSSEDIDVDGSSNTTTTTTIHATKYPYHHSSSSSKPLAGSDSVSPTPSIAEDARSRLSPRDSSDSSTYPTMGDGPHHPHPHGHTTDLLEVGDQQKPKIWSVTDFLHPGKTKGHGGVSSATEPSSCKETGMKMDTMRCVPTSAEAAAAAAAAAVDLTGRTVSVGGGGSGNGSVGVGGGVTSAAAAAHAHAAALSAAAAARGTAAGFFPPMTSLSPAQQLTSYQTALASYAAHSGGYGPYGGLGSMEMNKLVMKPTATRFGPYTVSSKPGGGLVGLVDSGFHPPARDFSVLREGE